MVREGRPLRTRADLPGEPTLNQKNNEAYREAIGLLRKVRGLMVRLGRESEFVRYLKSVRAAHKPKRNFMKLLDRAKWS